MAKASKSYAVVVTLSDADAAALGVEKVEVLANTCLRALAQGGVLVAPEWAERIKSAIGTTDAASITESVERCARRFGEARLVEWSVDPTQLAFYQQLADNAGVTLEHQLKSLLDYAYSQGWFGMGAPDPFKLWLSQDQYRALQQFFQKDIVTGQDVIERLGVSAVTQAESGDPLLDSLVVNDGI